MRGRKCKVRDTGGFETPPPPFPCTGSPFYNCLPFPQLRTSTRIHRLFSFRVSGSSGLKTTHRAGAGMVRLLLTTVSPLKRGPRNSLREKEKWKRVSTLCIHLPVRQNIAIIGQIIRKPRYFLVFLTFRPSSAARTSVKVILSVLTNSKYSDTDFFVPGIPCTETRSTIRFFKPFYCKEKNIENQRQNRNKATFICRLWTCRGWRSHSSARALMSPNKGETAVHGCHCPGDMAVHMREVLARRWVGVCVPLA